MELQARFNWYSKSNKRGFNITTSICHTISTEGYDNVEILPVNNTFSNKKYYFLNVTADLDCLTEKSIYEDGLVITNIKNYDFNYEVIKNSHFFKIKKVPTEIYVSDVFVKRVLDNKLRAFEFRPIWSKDNINKENIYSSKLITWYFKKW